MEQQDKLKEKIRSAQEQADEYLRQMKMGEAHREAIAPDVVESLLQTLEELHVAEEELRVQNEELGATRLTIEAERARYLDLFEFAPDGYLVTDLQGVIKEANQAASHLLGIQADHLVGKPLANFVCEADRKEFRRQLNHLPEIGQLRDWDFCLQPRNGERLPVAATVAVTSDDIDGVSGLRWMLRDMTQRRQAEEELRKHREHLEDLVKERTQALRDAQEQLIRKERLAAIGKFAGGIVHDLRHPLSVINNVIYLLNSTISDPDEETVKYLAMLTEEVNHAKNIITDLLNFARTSEAKQTSVIVSDLVKSVLSKHSPPDGVTVELNIPDDNPLAYVDLVHIEQTLTNLIMNAYQAMPDGGELTINSMQYSADGLLIDVSDTGIGISPENMEKIFEPLFTTKQKGIGLGLVTSKMLVEANDGHIEVESTEGKGSSFRIYVPAYRETECNA